MRVARVAWDGRRPTALAEELRSTQPRAEDLTEAVRPIIEDVRERGDLAVRELTRRLDRIDVPSSLVPAEQVAAAVEEIETEVRNAIDRAAENIRALAEAELESEAGVHAELAQGQRVRMVSSPVGSAGVYAPGGHAAYPSSVLMCCIPARVAGVARVAVSSPPTGDGTPAAPVLAACALAGADDVYAVGGAQAIAAMALGTESIPAVDVVAGPGNRYVVEAKRMLSGQVGIDGIAGPTELVVVCDRSARAEHVALDLCAQAEHGTDGLLVAISPDASSLDRVSALLPEFALQRPSVPDAPVALVSAPSRSAALELADAIAPEHLELQLEGADAAARDRVAGCVFAGGAAAAAFGDYAAGSNHVLPTGGAARFGAPLGPRTFLRRTSIVSISAGSAAALAPTVGALARAEGFPVHGESAEARAGENRSRA